MGKLSNIHPDAPVGGGGNGSFNSANSLGANPELDRWRSSQPLGFDQLPVARLDNGGTVMDPRDQVVDPNTCIINALSRPFISRGVLNPDFRSVQKDTTFLAEWLRTLNPDWATKFLEAAGKYPPKWAVGDFYPTLGAAIHVWEWAPVIAGDQQQEKVFKQLKQKPYYSAPSKTRSEDPFPDGMIDDLEIVGLVMKFVDDERFTIWNVTLPSHMFFPGRVQVQVAVQAGKTVLKFRSDGKGRFACANILVPPEWLFGPGVEALKRDLQTP